MNTRELEKLARSLAAQKLEIEYIRHYLQETFQVDAKTIDYVFERAGIGRKKIGGMSRMNRPAATKGKPH